MEVQFYLKEPKGIAKTAIWARVSYYGLRLKYYLPNISIEPKYWDKERKQAKQVKGFSQALEINRSLKQIKETIESCYFSIKALNNQKEPTTTVFKASIDKAFSKTNDTAAERQQKTFWAFFEKSIINMETGVRSTVKGNVFAKGTIKTFKNLFNKLKDFERHYGKKIEFDTINRTMYDGFLDYTLNVLELHRNTVGKQVTFWKNILRDAYESGLTTSTVFSTRWFKSFQEETFATYLKDAEIYAIAELDLSSQKKLERVRDLFVIGCYTGLRYSDLTSLTESSIKENLIKTVQKKTGDKVEIPLNPIVKQIIGFYGGTIPRNPKKQTPISNQKFNEYLKDICKQVPALDYDIDYSKGTGVKSVKVVAHKYELITSHTARRSFATNEFIKNDGLKTEDIMAITGHKTTKAFYKYIRLTPNDRAKHVAKVWATRDYKLLPTRLKAV